MYSAKRAHVGVAPYTADMRLMTSAEIDPPRDRERRREALRLRRVSSSSPTFAAPSTGRAHLVYQPKFAFASGRTSGVEALVRWPHPDRGLLLPADFLPLARQNGLMGAADGRCCSARSPTPVTGALRGATFRSRSTCFRPRCTIWSCPPGSSGSSPTAAWRRLAHRGDHRGLLLGHVLRARRCSTKCSGPAFGSPSTTSAAATRH